MSQAYFGLPTATMLYLCDVLTSLLHQGAHQPGKHEEIAQGQIWLS